MKKYTWLKSEALLKNPETRFKRFSRFSIFLVAIFGAAFFASPVYGQVVMVEGGTDIPMTLTVFPALTDFDADGLTGAAEDGDGDLVFGTLPAAIAATPPGTKIVIVTSGVWDTAISGAIVLAGPENFGKKIMAAPGVSAVITSSAPGGPGILVIGAMDVILENLNVHAFPGLPGIGVAATAAGGRARAKIINCQVTSCGVGVAVIGVALGSAVAEISGSRIMNNDLGVSLGDGSAGTIEKSEIRNNRNHGVFVAGRRQQQLDPRAKIWYNQIDYNGGDGVHVGDGEAFIAQVVISHNDISFNGVNGVAVFPGSLASVSNNTISYNTAVGLLALPGSTVTAAPGYNTVAGNSPNAVPAALLPAGAGLNQVSP